MPAYRIVQRLSVDSAAERSALVAGLRAMPASIPPKYFYDVLGCALYGAICELPEYYPTRTERAIFHEYRAEIAKAMGSGGQFVDLGAGDCCKGETLARVRRGKALRRGRHRRRGDQSRARPPRAGLSGRRNAGRHHRLHRGARSRSRSGRPSDDVLLSRLVDRQFHAGGGARVPARHPAALCRSGQRTPDRRRHQERQGAARRRLRRSARRYRGVQSQRAEPRESRARERFRTRCLCPSRLLQWARQAGSKCTSRRGRRKR